MDFDFASPTWWMASVLNSALWPPSMEAVLTGGKSCTERDDKTNHEFWKTMFTNTQDLRYDKPIWCKIIDCGREFSDDDSDDDSGYLVNKLWNFKIAF
jgi:hypothetical protein